MESLVTQLQATEEMVGCGWDASLEADLRQLKGHKYLLAANFRNNEGLLPHVIVQLWHLLAILPQGSVFVSVYESGSEDSTGNHSVLPFPSRSEYHPVPAGKCLRPSLSACSAGAWLEVLRQLVAAMQVPHRIVVGAPRRPPGLPQRFPAWRPQRRVMPAGGNLTRAEEQERIDFLAQVRNAALEPLWLDTVSDGGVAPTWFRTAAPRAEKAWPADRVVFMNDVYFCAKDVVRLLLHGADMACGMDFDRRKLDQIPREVRRPRPS